MELMRKLVEENNDESRTPMQTNARSANS